MPAKKYPPETIAAALQQYAEGERVADILAAHKMPPATLYYHLDRAARQRAGESPRRRVVASWLADEDVPQNALARRLFRTAARAVAVIDRRLGDPALTPAARARELHALRLIGRLCREITPLEPRAERAPLDPVMQEALEAEAETRRVMLQARAARLVEEIREALHPPPQAEEG